MLIGFNFLYRKRTIHITYYFILILLFGILLPFVAIKIEVETLILQGVERDGKNFLNIIFKYPFYWIIGVLEIMFLGIRNIARCKNYK